MSKGETIKGVVKDNLCTGCATCVSLCPQSAIKLTKSDSKGIYLPHINDEKCNQCGTCFDICPGHSVAFNSLNLEIFGKEPVDILLGNYLNCYIGYATDYEIRYNSSSGGLVTALLIFALEEGMIDGALVTRMKKDNPLEPEPFIARTREEIIEASKSKYCPVPGNIALKEILETEGKYAVVGVPCQIYGIRKAETINKKLEERIILHIGLFCNGPPNFRATEFLLYRRKVATDEIKALAYRGEGWPGNMALHMKNGKTEFISYPLYWSGFARLFFQFRCKICIDWFSKLADISFGDAWLPEVKKEDKVGTSIIISRIREAEDILQQMVHKEKIELNTITVDRVYDAQGGFSDKKRNLKAWITITKLLGKKIPAYNNGLLLQPPFRAYLSGMLLLCSQSFLASKRSRWWLLGIYCSLVKYGSRLKSKLGL